MRGKWEENGKTIPEREATKHKLKENHPSQKRCFYLRGKAKSVQRDLRKREESGESL